MEIMQVLVSLGKDIHTLALDSSSESINTMETKTIQVRTNFSEK